MEINYDDLWEEICFIIEKHRNDSEKEFQIIAESIFEKLGWKQYKGEIIKPSISFGAANRGIPDIVIQSDNIKHYVVELKKAANTISERNVEQLISYMRQLKLSYGILIGNSLQVYYESLSDDKPAIKVCEVPFDSQNKLGPIVIELLSKYNFSKEKFEYFCQTQIKKQTEKNERLKQIEFLCSDEGEQYIRSLLGTEYPGEVLGNIVISVKRKWDVVDPVVKDPIISDPSPIINHDLGSYNRKQNESIQEWVKRILVELFNNNLLSELEIKQLHNEEYSIRTFGISHALLCDNEKDINISGHMRYWTRWKLKGKYYVCSQWWKARFPEYERNIHNWLRRILK